MLRMLTAGESHGPCLVAIIDGLPAGLALNREQIDHQLARRQEGYGRGERQNLEVDRVEIISGLHRGVTSGGPLAVRIENRDWQNRHQEEIPSRSIPRPGNADLSGWMKYGLPDLRAVAERSSARETAARVAVGAVVRQLLEAAGMDVLGWVRAIGGEEAVTPRESTRELRPVVEASPVRTPDPEAARRMMSRIDDARAQGDTLGGILEVWADRVPPGLGSHVQYDRRLDARLGGGLLSIPAIKGVEIGTGFAQASLPGSRVHDPISWDEGPVRSSNNAGGLEGGVTNGERLVLRAAMKPIATMARPLGSVDLATGEPTPAPFIRSDTCAVPAASVVAEAVVCWMIAAAVLEAFGNDRLEEILTAVERRREWVASRGGTGSK